MTNTFGHTEDHQAQYPDALEIRRYNVRLAIHPVEVNPFHQLYGGDIDVVCRITVKNTGDVSCAEIPLNLYRLLEVCCAKDHTGEEVPFTQRVQKSDRGDDERTQINRVTLHLEQALRPNEERAFTIEYAGPICGCPESLPYAWDHVSWDYTLLRSEVDWSPTVAYTKRKLPPFTYRVDVSVPSRLIAVAEGKLLETQTIGDRTIYSYESERPHTFLFSIAAASFEKREVGSNITFYFLPEDAEGVDVAIRALERTEELCGMWFGISPQKHLKIVEIPQKYGGQSAPGLILQPSGAFRADDGDRSAAYRRALSAFGHEEIHRWHPRPHEQDRTRFLDEGITHYIEALLIKEEFGEEAYREVLEGYRQRFLRGGNEALQTPIAESYNSEEISRGKGPWVLYTLHQWLGDEAFFEIMRTYFKEYQETRVKLEDFVAVAKDVSSEDLERFFEEWFYGTESSRYLKDGLSVEQMVACYQ